MFLLKTSLILAGVAAFPARSLSQLSTKAVFDGQEAGPTDSDDHVSLFKKKDFHMESNCNPRPGESRSLCNGIRNKLSSVRVPDGMRVRLWKPNCNHKHCNHKDKMVELLDDVAAFDGFDNDFTYIDVESYDKESNPHLWLKSNPESDDKLKKARYFYPGQDIAVQGTYFGPDVLNDYTNGHRWASSLCLQKGLKLTLWDGNFFGDSHVITSRDQDVCMDLADIGWDKRVYSLRLEHLAYEFGPNEGMWVNMWSSDVKKTQNVMYGTSLTNTQETVTTIGTAWSHSVALEYTYTPPEATGGSGGSATYTFAHEESRSTAEMVGEAFTTTSSRTVTKSCPDDNMLAMHPGETFWMYTWVMKGSELTTSTELEVYSEHDRCVPESEGPPRCPPGMYELANGDCELSF